MSNPLASRSFLHPAEPEDSHGLTIPEVALPLDSSPPSCPTGCSGRHGGTGLWTPGIQDRPPSLTGEASFLDAARDHRFSSALL
jgi:hypothetical protein